MSQLHLFGPEPIYTEPGFKLGRGLVWCKASEVDWYLFLNCHHTGWRIEHCGHPTALMPYTAFKPDGRLLVKRAFQTLQQAKDEVAKHI